MPDKLQKLQDMMKLVNEGLSREEFLANFKVIIDLVKKLKDENQVTMNNWENRYDHIVESIRRDYDSDMDAVKKKALQYCMDEMKGVMKNHEKEMESMRDFVETMESRISENVLEEAIQTSTEQILSQIPTIEQVMQELPRAGSVMRDAFELLPEGEKLKIEAIEHLREELDELKRKMQRSTANNFVGGGGGRLVKLHDLSDSLNGVTSTFPIPAMLRIISVSSSSFPNALRPTVDYTHDASASTITFTAQIDPATTLATGQTLLIIYSE